MEAKQRYEVKRSSAAKGHRTHLLWVWRHVAALDPYPPEKLMSAQAGRSSGSHVRAMNFMGFPSTPFAPLAFRQ